jgi:hypothetical protein
MTGRSLWRPYAAALGCFILGCGSPAASDRNAPFHVPEAPDELTVYSIDGNDDAYQRPKTEETLGGYPVLGKIEITNPETRREILTALREAKSDSRNWTTCYWPRHAVRVVEKGIATEYMIYFECLRLHYEVDGRKGAVMMQGEGARTLRDLLNKHLKAAAVPLARGAEK